MIMKDILSMSFSELTGFVTGELKESPFRARQISEWLTKGATFDEMSNLSLSLREKLKSSCTLYYPEIKRKLVSAIDGTVKYLMRLSDGNCIECVLMEYEHGTTICISTQVGCRMGCRFCASTIGGKLRDLGIPSFTVKKEKCSKKPDKKQKSSIF